MTPLRVTRLMVVKRLTTYGSIYEWRPAQPQILQDENRTLRCGDVVIISHKGTVSANPILAGVMPNGRLGWLYEDEIEPA